MILVVLFGLFIALSLATSLALALGILPGSPAVLLLVGAIHAVVAWLFFRAYRRYHNLFRLVAKGEGQLFDLAVSHLVANTRTRGFRDHYRLRRLQGLVATGNALEALAALDQLNRHARLGPHDEITALTAEIEANLELDQRFWAEQAAARAAEVKGASRHAGLRAAQARLMHVKGRHAEAADQLALLQDVRSFPLTSIHRARNRRWYAESLLALGRAEDAARAFEKARKTAPKSWYARPLPRQGSARAA